MEKPGWEGGKKLQARKLSLSVVIILLSRFEAESVLIIPFLSGVDL